MIYDRQANDSRIDQGDIIRGCPLVRLVESASSPTLPLRIRWGRERVIVLSQTCDLAQDKVTQVVVAVAIPAAEIVARGELKAADVRGTIRAGRVFGWYFLPKDDDLQLPELIVDLRQLHTVPRAILDQLCRNGERDGRIRTPWREHLAKHFADTYSRIGLPEPYATEQTA